LKDRKKNIISRHTDSKVYNIMMNLEKHLQGQTPDLDKANQALRDMKTIMVRKISWNTGGAATNIAMAVTLACSAFFPISAFALPAVIGGRAVFGIAKHSYEQFALHKGLEAPEFLTAVPAA